MSVIQKKVSVDLLAEMREVFLLEPDAKTHDSRAKRVKSRYPQFSLATLRDYSRLTMNSSERTWELFVAGRITLGQLTELVGITDPERQTYLANETVERGLAPKQLAWTKSYLKEGDAFEVAIGKATGRIDPTDPRRADRKNLDTLLGEIARDGSKLRARISQAAEAVGEVERETGVTLPLYDKLYHLSHMAEEQAAFLRNKLSRYTATIKRRINGEPSNGTLGFHETKKEE